MNDIQRYTLTTEPDGRPYMELDPDGRYMLAKEVAAHIDALTAAVRDVEAAYDRVNGWHDTAYDEVTNAMYAVLAILRGES